MDQLWAPWRMSYVSTARGPGDDECFLCRGLAADDDRANLIVRRTPLGAVVLNRYPYANGHLLVVPRAHKATLQELTTEEMLDTMTALTQSLDVVKELLRPDGFNVGLNLGKAAGAGVPGHLHWHVVPRWAGDTNFMPMLADVRIIVQSLDTLYGLLRDKIAGPDNATTR